MSIEPIKSRFLDWGMGALIITVACSVPLGFFLMLLTDNGWWALLSVIALIFFYAG